jgi:hypothetical protein
MMGYALLTTAMNQPFGFPDDYMDNETNPDALDFETLLQVWKFTLTLINIPVC